MRSFDSARAELLHVRAHAFPWVPKLVEEVLRVIDPRWHRQAELLAQELSDTCEQGAVLAPKRGRRRHCEEACFLVSVELVQELGLGEFRVPAFDEFGVLGIVAGASARSDARRQIAAAALLVNRLSGDLVEMVTLGWHCVILRAGASGPMTGLRTDRSTT